MPPLKVSENRFFTSTLSSFIIFLGQAVMRSLQTKHFFDSTTYILIFLCTNVLIFQRTLSYIIEFKNLQKRKKNQRKASTQKPFASHFEKFAT